MLVDKTCLIDRFVIVCLGIILWLNGKGHAQKILYTNTRDIRVLDSATGEIITVASGNSYALFVDHDPINGYVYWSDMTAGTISRKKFPLDGSNTEILVDGHTTNPVGIAVDPHNNHLYWLDKTVHTLCRIDLDGSNKIDVLSGLGHPPALALDTKNGWLYHSEGCRTTPFIEKCKLDGSNRQIIISNDISCPEGLNLDFREERIYWVDVTLTQIKSANLDGSDVKLLVSRSGITLGIYAYGDNIYFTAWSGDLYKTNKSPGSSAVSIHSDNIKGIAVIDINDGCFEYQHKKNEDKRSIDFKMEASSTEILNDEFLEENWYRFVSYNGDEMPTNPPGVYSCGTKHPIWLNGTLPSKADKNVAVNACMQTELDTCEMTILINITDCGTYYVYYLTNTSSNSSFCVGSGPVRCPDGLSSESGFYPGCNSSFPNTTVVPVVEALLIDGPPEPVPPNMVPSPSLLPVFRCSFIEKVDESYVFDIYWYINGNNITNFKNVPYSSINDTILRDGDWTDSYQLNMQVSCAVRIRYSHDALPGPYQQSLVFHAGLYPEKYEYTVIEGEAINISLTSTVPVACVSSASYFLQHCARPITVSQPKLGEDKSECYNNIASRDIVFKTEKCGIEISTSNWKEPKHLQVYGFSDGLYNWDDRSTYIKLSTFSGSVFHDIWKDIKIPEIKVSVIDKDSVLTNRICQSYNDPHITTFDGRLYHYMEVGEFVMYRNDIGPYWVHALFTNCGFGWDGSSCHCGIAIRSRQSLFVLRTCEKISRKEKILLQQPVIDLKSCDTADMLIETKGHEYKVTLPIGTEITFRISTWSKFIGMISIKPSIYDVNIAKGLCGVPSFTKDPSDDLTHRQDGPVNDDQYFADSWRIQETMINEQLFVLSPNFLSNKNVIYVDDFVESGRLERYCTCEREAGTSDSMDEFYTLHCNLTESSPYLTGDSQQDDQTINSYHTSCSKSSRRKRSVDTNDQNGADSDDLNDLTPLIYDDDVEDNETETKTFRNGWTEVTAYQHCQEKIIEAVPEKIYSGIVEINQEFYIQSCVKDIELVGGPTFLQDTIATMMVFILTEAKRNESLYITRASNDSQSVLEYISSMLCPNNCSNNGNCSKGKCSCYDGFMGDDCSEEISKPPTDISIPTDGLCTLETRECKRTNVYGSFPSETVWYKLKHFEIQKDDVVFASEEQIGQAEYRNYFLVSIGLPSRRRKRSTQEKVMADGYQISLSNDMENFGEIVNIIVYDDGCYTCNSTSITCTILEVCQQNKSGDNKGTSLTSVAVGITLGCLAFGIVAVILVCLIYNKNKAKSKTDAVVISSDPPTRTTMNREKTISSLNIELSDHEPSSPVELFFAYPQSCRSGNYKTAFNPATLSK